MEGYLIFMCLDLSFVPLVFSLDLPLAGGYRMVRSGSSLTGFAGLIPLLPSDNQPHARRAGLAVLRRRCREEE